MRHLKESIMIQIYKYPVLGAEVSPVQEIEFSKGAEILSAGYDLNGDLCVWATHNDDAEKVTRNVYCIGTGWPLDKIILEDNFQFLNTVKEGPYVWHIFCGGEK